MAIAADDEVVVHGDAQWLRDLHDHPRHFNIGARGCRVSSGMIVHHDHRSGGELECPLDNLTRVDRGMVDGPGLVLLVGNQAIAFIDPFTYSVHGFKAVLLKGVGLAAIWPDLLYLGGFAFVMFALSTLLFKRTL